MRAVLAALVLLAALAPAASAANGLELTTSFPAVAVAPGSKVTFELDVVNNRAGRVNLQVSGVPSGWTATLKGGGFVVDGVMTDGSKPTTVQLDVQVASDASGSHRITVAASDGSRSATLPLDLRVSEAAAGNVTLESNTPTLQGASDETFTFDLTLRNDTPEPQTVSVSATGPQGLPNWNVQAKFTSESQAASTKVDAGSSTGIQVTVTPASDTAAGTYPITVQATAGSRTISGQLAVDITGKYGITFDTQNQVLSTHGAAGSRIELPVIVTNNGTAALTNVTLSATTPTNWKVDFDQPTIASIDPGKTVNATAFITPTGDAITGDYVVTIKAGNDQATASKDIRVTVETSLLGGLVGVGVIVVVLGGLGYVFRRYGRR